LYDARSFPLRVEYTQRNARQYRPLVPHFAMRSTAKIVCAGYSGGTYFPASRIRDIHSACGNPERNSSFASLSTSYSTRRMLTRSPSITKYEARRSPSYDWLTLPLFATVISPTRLM